LITGTEMSTTEGCRDKIDRLGRAANKDDFARFAGIQEALHLPTGVLVVLRRALAKCVDAAMDVGVVGLVVAMQHIDHCLRFLRGCGVVKVYQWLATNLLAQNREILPDSVHIECRPARLPEGSRQHGTRNLHGHGDSCFAPDERLVISRSRRSRSEPTLMRSI